ncbi:MAG TPA: ATP-binding protein, partial [Polyangiales bacterium]|nr:ATP-binding protein [Polyangiales bacterium]
QPDGSVRWLLCRRSPHGVGIVLDVSELRRSEDGRQRSRAQEVVATLAARLAHDFNNLLFAILGNATLALGTAPLGDQHPIRESLREIQRAAERASDIVHRLSAFARPVQPRRQRVVVSTPIEAALAALRPHIAPSVRVVWRKPTPELLVSADAKLLQDLVANLLLNGVQAMEHQGGELTVEVEPVALSGGELALPPGRYLELRVRDRGVGMERSTLERAFEPFFSTRPKGMGMGLGLSIAQGVVTTHGGALRIESSPGVGTTVRVYLPQL